MNVRLTHARHELLLLSICEGIDHYFYTKGLN
jgi:hypothetical protein